LWILYKIKAKEGFGMNKKIEQFDKMLEKNKISAFVIEKVEDDLHTVAYRSNMEIEGKDLPMALMMDDSIYTVIHIGIALNVANDDNKAKIADCLNDLNRQFKIFKYYISENNDILLDCCIPSSNEHFDAELVRTMLDVILRHLEEKYKEVMKLILAVA
jgi:hydrogenase maturation factor